MGCISSKHTGLSSKQGRPSRASILPIVNSFLKIDKQQLLQDDQRKKLLLQDGLKVDKHKVPQQDARSEEDWGQDEQDSHKSLHQMLEDEPEVINVRELMEGLEDDSNSRAVSSKPVESSESRNTPGSPSLICPASVDGNVRPVAGSVYTDPEGSPRLCLDSSVKRRFKTANRSTLDTNRTFSFKLMYLGDQASTPKLILGSNSPLLQKEELRSRLIMSRESNAIAPRHKDSPAHGEQLEDQDEEDLLCTFENMLEQLSSDEWLSRREESFDPESPASLSMAKKQQGDESSTALYFSRVNEAQQNEYNAMKSILLNYGTTVNEKEIYSNTQALIDPSIPLPALFINGRYIGGAEQLLELEKDGQLGLLLNQKTDGEQCQGCAGVRSFPCLDCNGSLRFVAEDGKLQACMECNKNGVVRCPLCS